MMTREEAISIAEQMAGGANEVQIAQTYFRALLVEAWGIPPGAKVLEIGCGQGDTTAVLAYAVGRKGHVTAVDLASLLYGSPITVGKAAEYLKKTSLGDRITFHFEYDVLAPSSSFPADAFDYVVLAHCSWYFGTLEQFRQVLLRVRPWASRLCYSEWEMEPQAMDQVAHLLAILIQGQVEAHKVDSSGNVRTPFSRARLKQLVHETGWKVAAETMLDSTPLQDADWEIDYCLRSSLTEAEALNLPLKHRDLLSSQVDVLGQMAERGKTSALGSYAILAEKRAGE